MALNYRKTFKVGPLRFNVTKNGLSSVSTSALGMTTTLWSKTGRRGLRSVNLPGGAYYRKF